MNYIVSIAGSGVIYLICMELIPYIINLANRHANVQRLILILAGVLVIAISMLLITTLIYLIGIKAKKPGDVDMKKLWTYIKRSKRAILFFIAAGIVLAIICGIIAAAVYFIAKEGTSYDRIKSIINLIVDLLLIILSPVLLMETLSLVVTTRPWKQALSYGMEKLKSNYLKILLINCTLVLAGLVVSIIFYFMGTGIIINIFRLLVFSSIGGLGMCYILNYTLDIYRTR